MTALSSIDADATTEIQRLEPVEDGPKAPNRHEVRAAEFRAFASDARRAGEAAGLQHVREKFERSARVWSDLADGEDSRMRSVVPPLRR
jgi:hypothetical protein